MSLKYTCIVLACIKAYMQCVLCAAGDTHMSTQLLPQLYLGSLYSCVAAHATVQSSTATVQALLGVQAVLSYRYT